MTCKPEMDKVGLRSFSVPSFLFVKKSSGFKRSCGDASSDLCARDQLGQGT